MFILRVDGIGGPKGKPPEREDFKDPKKIPNNTPNSTPNKIGTDTFKGTNPVIHLMGRAIELIDILRKNPDDKLARNELDTIKQLLEEQIETQKKLQDLAKSP